MLEKFKEKVHTVEEVKNEYLEYARNHLDSLTKPPGSLGKLEDIAARFCGIHKTLKPQLSKKNIYTFAADHGVTEEGVSAYPASVTPQMLLNFVHGGAAVNVLSKTVGAKVIIIDIGVNYDFDDIEGLLHKKVKYGTNNFLKEEAMNEKELTQALSVGFALAEKAQNEGIQLIGTGDMGIGNTTSSSAIYSALLNLPPEVTTGKGTGIDEHQLVKKIDIIKKAMLFHENKLSDPFTVLQALGGLEIAGICGLIIGASYYKIPVLVDGFISGSAACAAIKMNQKVKDYLFFSHLSAEKGHKAVMNAMNVEPLLSLDMRLGEGTGAAVAMNLFTCAINIFTQMATFQSASVSERNAG